MIFDLFLKNKGLHAGPAFEFLASVTPRLRRIIPFCPLYLLFFFSETWMGLCIDQY
jgi:hypothetical protein